MFYLKLLLHVLSTYARIDARRNVGSTIFTNKSTKFDMTKMFVFFHLFILGTVPSLCQVLQMEMVKSLMRKKKPFNIELFTTFVIGPPQKS